MSQARKPPRLWLRTITSAAGRKTKTWFIKDGEKRISTGCSENEVERASQRLADHIAQGYEPDRSGRSSEVTVADALIFYDEVKADKTIRPRETRQILARLNEFFGDKEINKIRGTLCREFVKARGTVAGARRDLEMLRAAIHFYHTEYPLDVLPVITLPEKSLPREGFLTRSQVAALIWAARKRGRCQHIIRLILIGIYTGTRPGAVLSLQWMPSTTGGWVDVEGGVIYRRAIKERMAHNKRKTPVKIPPRLLWFLRKWKKADTARDGANGSPSPMIRHVIHFRGVQVTKVNKAFRSIREDAGFGADITPHLFRHTRGTWLAQKGVKASVAAPSLGLTDEEYERTYLHNDPEFQREAANAY